jgi:hypothetical protein
MTTLFTTDNTAGFSPASLADLNTAAAVLLPLGTDDDWSGSVVDALTNAWYDGVSVARLVRDAAERLRFEVCDSPDGWSLHAAGATDEAIANGDAPVLASGAWDA